MHMVKLRHGAISMLCGHTAYSVKL